LIELLTRGLQVKIRNRDRLIAETDSANPAFLKELMRRAALDAADQIVDCGSEFVVTD